jgi:predicted DNA-binding transcriptional regulator AlpA
VKLIKKLIVPLVDEGVITVAEEREISANLMHLAKANGLLPAVQPKLIDQREAAEMLGLSHSNFKKLEKEEAFPFKRRMLGSSVRYRNTDIITFILSDTGEDEGNSE